MVMATLKEQIGTRIKSLRERAGISGNAFAAKAGISQPHLWQVENGEKEASMAMLKKIADALGVPLNELMPR